VLWTRDSGVSTEGIRPPLAFLFLSSWQIDFLFHWPHDVLVPSVYKFGVLALFLFQFFYFGTFFFEWQTCIWIRMVGVGNFNWDCLKLQNVKTQKEHFVLSLCVLV
jgi:hypothetical protein